MKICKKYNGSLPVNFQSSLINLNSIFYAKIIKMKAYIDVFNLKNSQRKNNIKNLHPQYCHYEGSHTKAPLITFFLFYSTIFKCQGHT